jgi:hypothetical protein
MRDTSRLYSRKYDAWRRLRRRLQFFDDLETVMSRLGGRVQACPEGPRQLAVVTTHLVSSAQDERDGFNDREKKGRKCWPNGVIGLLMPSVPELRRVPLPVQCKVPFSIPG